MITAVMQYTLYPNALVPQMVAEVSGGMQWVWLAVRGAAAPPAWPPNPSLQVFAIQLRCQSSGCSWRLLPVHPWFGWLQVSRALTWTLDNAEQLGGSPQQVGPRLGPMLSALVLFGHQTAPLLGAIALEFY